MKALLLAAGFGVRLRPVTNSVPKCLVPIDGVPLLDVWLDLLFEGGIESVLINTHYLPEQVSKHIARSPWRDRITLVHENDLLGTGGTVLRNRDFFGTGPFLVAHADNLTWFDLTEFRARHENRPAGAVMTMMTFRSDTPWTCGIVEENADGLVYAFHEKVANPPKGNANGAVYIFEPEVMDLLASFSSSEVDLSTEVLPRYLGRIATFLNDFYLRDIGTLESLKAAERDFREIPLFREIRRRHT